MSSLNLAVGTDMSEQKVRTVQILPENLNLRQIVALEAQSVKFSSIVL